MIKILGKNGSLFTQFISEIRDRDIQKDRLRFRRNLERTGEIFAYEISKTLEYADKTIETPLGTATEPLSNDKIILGTILRAGLPFHNGFLNYFDSAENAFISAYRKYGNDNKFNIQIEYISSPSPKDKILILSDPMLASGHSMVLAYKSLVKRGIPRHTHIVALIASAEGLELIKKELPKDKYTIWVGAIDDELTVKSYIVPGLGDAGDLAFGGKE